ncbi:zinc ABC transporter substrate-binding protein ZnuA [Azospirillum sp. RWY-5-1]|uniref:High-affinity zinc uptake system protein ZnuA n=1 Tax=Azospirillum oleiclasticum TaxID=2735135 RepID=A0ABX2TC85_9PROT|nr:zinc ABC transporter substrate-binding protein ZnuA [Azospirillum oleiclasticum]NYZ13012.1 zinc ABC transporter substrate-binding protein ZnuA [Azospirillum oleiclasticum]NYZ20315.1 zinc ABC transporter substrate-binding protein ZnuA [Azospirillum oleiclasticum]
MRRIFVSAALLLATALPAAAEAPKVVASIKPVHSIVAAVMQGVGEPQLVVKGAASPHTYALKPSDARALQDARLVFWVGPELEGFLAKPLKVNATKARAVSLMGIPGLPLLETREGGAWEEDDHGHSHGHSHAHEHGHDDHEEHNAHIWLDPRNVRLMVGAVAETLAKADPANAAAYSANATAYAARIDALDAELERTLAPLRDRPFVVFHDAYPYLENRYDLNAVGAITVNPERRPSAKRLKEIRAKIAGLDAACVFAEPQFEPALVNTIIEGTGARKGVLDPEGADIPDGPDLYPTLMRRNAAALVDCLKG